MMSFEGRAREPRKNDKKNIILSYLQGNLIKEGAKAGVFIKIPVALFFVCDIISQIYT
jgi:hypothetical protein